MKKVHPSNFSLSGGEQPEKIQCPSAKISAPRNEHLLTAEGLRTRQVPLLNEASVAFHKGITDSQESFSLKSAAERLKKHTDQ